jgi:hypothetical protein
MLAPFTMILVWAAIIAMVYLAVLLLARGGSPERYPEACYEPPYGYRYC